MSIRAKLFLAGSLPAAFCITFWYLSWVEGDTSDGRWLFVLGLMSAVIAITLGRTTWLSHRQDVLEGVHERENARLARNVRDLERDLAVVREDVNSRLATKAWREAGFRAAVNAGNRQLHSVVEQMDS